MLEKYKKRGHLSECFDKIVKEINDNNTEYQKEGRQEGRKEGKKQKSIEISKKLLKMNFSIEQIEEITGLKKKFINLL